MNRSEIFSKIESICRKIFGEDIVITEKTAATDIEKWDSMNHVILIATIEKEFAVTFDIMEIIGITTIGDFVDLVDKKTKLMQITEIKVAGLADFMAGSLWQNLSPKPITLLRAISQSHNPRANPEDIALIIVCENKELIGLVGLLPDFLHGESSQPASSNTCWWVNPEKGKHLAVPLFLKAFAVCNQRMFMTDCTPHTQSILERTNWFDFPETAPGIRGFLKFNLHELIPAKFPATRNLESVLKMIDKTFNFLLIPYQKNVGSGILKDGPKVECFTELNQELDQFMEIHSGNEFIRRSGKELEWIMQHPWIRKKTDDQFDAPYLYPFSHLVADFEQYFVKVTEAGKTIGLLFISVRDGHLKVPYSYFPQEKASLVLKVIYQQAILRKAVTLTIFCPKLVKTMNSVFHPFIFKKRIKRLIGISKQLSDFYAKYPKIQDGDGDVVFT